MSMLKIKKGDTVKVIAGKDKDKEGNIKRALGVKNDYVLGAAFDLELQEQKKEERKRIKKISDKKEHRHKHHHRRSRSRSRS